MSVATKFPPGPTHKIPGKLFRQFVRDPINTLSNIAREYGDISHFKLGRENVYLINDPDYIEKVLIHKFQISYMGMSIISIVYHIIKAKLRWG
jgi:hypothetical protein